MHFTITFNYYSCCIHGRSCLKMISYFVPVAYCKRYRSFHSYYYALARRNGQTELTFPPTLSRCSRTSPARCTRWPSSVLPSRRVTRTASSDRPTQTASRRHFTGRYGSVFRGIYQFFCTISLYKVTWLVFRCFIAYSEML